MLLKEAKEILKKHGYMLDEAKGDGKHRWGKYSFSNPKADTKYVKVLALLAKAGNTGASKKSVHIEMGWPTDHGNHSAMWTELREEGLVDYNEETRCWTITDMGKKMLADVNGKKTNQAPVSALDGDQIEFVILQLLVVAHQKSSEGGRISVADLSNKYFKNNKYDDILDALNTSMESGFVDYDSETNGDYFFILPRGIKFLRDNEIMPAKNTSYTSVIDGTLDFEAPAEVEKPAPAKKPVDLDDDMYDDTPIVKQRDESFRGFVKSHLV